MQNTYIIYCLFKYKIIMKKLTIEQLLYEFIIVD